VNSPYRVASPAPNNYTTTPSRQVRKVVDDAPVLPAEDRCVGLVDKRHVLVGQNEAIVAEQVAQVCRRSVVHLHVETHRCTRAQAPCTLCAPEKKKTRQQTQGGNSVVTDFQFFFLLSEKSTKFPTKYSLTNSTTHFFPVATQHRRS